uniref:Reverse transcriptase domain-containing protein n=1 Tax=Megaselia scalaris TaxID=36166 RepID=T1GV04_MEGSC
MNQFGIHKKLIKLCQITLKDKWSSVRVAGKISDKFHTIKGFLQGDTLSFSFFNILLQMIMKSANIDNLQQIGSDACIYDIHGRTSSKVKDKFLAIKKSANSVGLNVNSGKTKPQ